MQITLIRKENKKETRVEDGNFYHIIFYWKDRFVLPLYSTEKYLAFR